MVVAGARGRALVARGAWVCADEGRTGAPRSGLSTGVVSKPPMAPSGLRVKRMLEMGVATVVATMRSRRPGQVRATSSTIDRARAPGARRTPHGQCGSTRRRRSTW